MTKNDTLEKLKIASDRTGDCLVVLEKVRSKTLSWYLRSSIESIQRDVIDVGGRITALRDAVDKREEE